MRKQANITFLVNSDLYADADHAVHVFHVRSTSDDDVHEYGFSGSPAIIPDHAQSSVFFVFWCSRYRVMHWYFHEQRASAFILCMVLKAPSGDHVSLLLCNEV